MKIGQKKKKGFVVMLSLICFSLVAIVSFFVFSNLKASLNSGDAKKVNLQSNLPVATKNKKKKIIIFSSRGGGGHASVSRAMKSYLGDDNYDIKVVNTVADILHPLDPIRTITFKKYSGVDFYNYLLSRGYSRVNSLIARIGRRMFRWRRKKVEKLLRAYVDQEKPDMIISVFPIFNFAFLNISQKLNIPFLIVTNDLDTSMYINGIKSPTYEKFRYTIPFEDNKIREKIAAANFKKEQVVVSGFPIRVDFFEKKNKEQIRKDFNIPSDKNVVMILMGAAGSKASYRYVRRIAKMNKPLHLLICVGRDEKTKKKIEKLKMNPNISCSVIGFTQRISDLMSVSDLFITKPGPNSITEAMQMNLPMAIDKTSNTLFWEKLNIAFAVKNGFGVIVKRYKNIPRIIQNMVFDEKNNEKIREKMSSFKKENFKDKIPGIVKGMLKV